MSPITPENNRIKKHEKRLQILEAAEAVFAVDGYHAASIANIAAKSGISKGLLYTYFKNKEDLLKQLILKGIEEMFSYFKLNPNISSQENLIIMVEKSFSVLEDMHEVFMIYFSSLFNRKIFDLLKTEMEELMIPLMEEIVKLMAGLGFDKPFEEAVFFRSMLDGLGVSYVLMPEDFPKEYCINRVKNLYIK